MQGIRKVKRSLAAIVAALALTLAGAGMALAATQATYANHIDVKYAVAVTDGDETGSTVSAVSTIACTADGTTYYQNVEKSSGEFQHKGSPKSASGSELRSIPSTAVVTFTATIDGVQYTVELDQSDVYPANTYYPTTGDNASKIGTYYGIKPVDGKGYDISGLSVFTVSTIVCDGSKVSYGSVSNGGLDLILNVATIVDNATNVVQGVKILEGRDLAEGEFSFAIVETGSSWQPLTGDDAYTETVVNEGDGVFLFSALSYNKAGTYYYVVTETVGSDADIAYDDIIYYVTHVVTLDTNNSAYTVDASIQVMGEDGALAEVDEIVFTNVYSPKISISGSKTWDDADDQDGIRPESITVKLTADDITVKTMEVTEADGWAWTFADLPKYRDGGVEICYSVAEEPVEGYETEIDGTNITNTHAPEVVTVSGSKTWDDADDQDGIRPESITVKLTADGEVVATAVVTAEGNWAYSFSDLPKYRDGGVEIVYAVTEEAVEGYEASVDGYDIVNTHVPETIELVISKVWDDAEDEEGLRPESIVVNLLADGEVYDVLTITAEANSVGDGSQWVYEVTDLPKYDAGVEIVWTVEEVNVPEGYEMTCEESDEGFVITNSHEPTPPIAETGDDLSIAAGILAFIACVAAALGTLSFSKMRGLRRQV